MDIQLNLYKDESLSQLHLEGLNELNNSKI